MSLQSMSDITALEVEIEFTNRCNAHCTACPRADMPAFGLMELATLEKILGIVEEIRAAHVLVFGEVAADWPKVTVAGGGEPFLHRGAIALLEKIRRVTSNLHVITNGSALTAERAAALVALKPASIACSFWGITREEYEAAMSLPYERTLKRVIHLAQVAQRAAIPFEIVWVRVSELCSKDEEILAFWKRKGISVNIGNSGMWNRGGLLTADTGFAPSPGCIPPDPARRIWCAEVSFSVAFDWRGDCVLCCCSFFDRNHVTLGSALIDNWAVLARRKHALLKARPLPTPCRNCLLPRRAQAEWLAAPILDRLSREERELILYPSS
jgi:hypothetical protein